LVSADKRLAENIGAPAAGLVHERGDDVAGRTDETHQLPPSPPTRTSQSATPVSP